MHCSRRGGIQLARVVKSLRTKFWTFMSLSPGVVPRRGVGMFPVKNPPGAMSADFLHHLTHQRSPQRRHGRCSHQHAHAGEGETTTLPSLRPFLLPPLIPGKLIDACAPHHHSSHQSRRYFVLYADYEGPVQHRVRELTTPSILASLTRMPSPTTPGHSVRTVMPATTSSVTPLINNS